MREWDFLYLQFVAKKTVKAGYVSSKCISLYFRYDKAVEESFQTLEPYHVVHYLYKLWYVSQCRQ